MSKMEKHKTLIERIKEELDKNNNKLSPEFIEVELDDEDIEITHRKMTPNTRVCVIRLTSGHDLVGYAQVLDSANDVELIGQQVAYENAKNNIWSVYGSIAKALQEST